MSLSPPEASQRQDQSIVLPNARVGNYPFPDDTCKTVGRCCLLCLEPRLQQRCKELYLIHISWIATRLLWNQWYLSRSLATKAGQAKVFTHTGHLYGDLAYLSLDSDSAMLTSLWLHPAAYHVMLDKSMNDTICQQHSLQL